MPRPVRGSEPLPIRWAGIGAGVGGVLGGVAGLIIGLTVHWQTACFAIFELGIPSLLVGFVLGLVAGAIALLVRRH